MIRPWLLAQEPGPVIGLMLLILAAAMWAAYNWGIQAERGRWEEKLRKQERKSRDHRDLGGHIRF